jgi:hypothetical protein
MAEFTVLNPNCVFPESNQSFGYNDPETWEEVFDGVIRGYEGSTAQAYAEEHGYTFESLGDAPTVPVSGDYNSDGEVTVADAVLLARFISEDISLTAEQIEGILNHEPDQDGDNLITIMDIAAILKKLESA